MYPDDCVQSLIHPSTWWIENSRKILCRGALVSAFVPHIDQVPYTFEPLARAEATRHDSATIRVAPSDWSATQEDGIARCCNAFASG